jgi:hypothetical protein
LDACFKLTSKGTGKKSVDEPELAPGGGVFVDEQKFQEFIKKHKKLADVSGSIGDCI